jgi:hypothetical protein
MAKKRGPRTIWIPPAKNALQLKVELKYIRPPIWRKVLMPDNFTVGQLHEVLQITMGWHSCHMHAFRVPRRGFGPPLREFGSGLDDAEDENMTFLGTVLLRQRQKLIYEYDFGDGWLHDVAVEKIVPFDPQAQYPVCIDGARACPPEDCGGFPGYLGILEALKAPKKTQEQNEPLEWLPGGYDPEHFDLASANRRLAGKG